MSSAPMQASVMPGPQTCGPPARMHCRPLQSANENGAGTDGAGQPRRRDVRTHFCGEVTERVEGEPVAVCGWLHRRRDHGGVIFIGLRDRTGLLQIVIDPDTPEAFSRADRARSEYVLRVEMPESHRYQLHAQLEPMSEMRGTSTTS